MSNTVEFQSKVGPDGTLDLRVPLGVGEAGTDVIVSIRPANGSPAPQIPADWHRFVEQTYGSCAGLDVERRPQGPIEKRESIE